MTYFTGIGIPRGIVRARRGDLYLNRESGVIWVKTMPPLPSDPPNAEGWILPPCPYPSAGQ